MFLSSLSIIFTKTEVFLEIQQLTELTPVGKDVRDFRAMSFSQEQFEEMAKRGFGSNLNVLAEMYIASGSNTTPEALAARTGLPEEKVVYLFSQVEFWQAVRRRIIKRNFTLSKFKEFVNYCMYNLSNEYYSAIAPEQIHGATAEYLEERMINLKRVEKMASEVYAMGEVDEPEVEEPAAALERVTSSEAFKYFQQRMGGKSQLDAIRALDVGPNDSSILDEPDDARPQLKIVEEADD